MVCKSWSEATLYKSLYNCAVFMRQESIDKARLLWTNDTYHPFSAIEFTLIHKFPKDFAEILDYLGKTVTVLDFNDCKIGKSLYFYNMQAYSLLFQNQKRWKTSWIICRM